MVYMFKTLFIFTFRTRLVHQPLFFIIQAITIQLVPHREQSVLTLERLVAESCIGK